MIFLKKKMMNKIDISTLTPSRRPVRISGPFVSNAIAMGKFAIFISWPTIFAASLTF